MTYYVTAEFRIRSPRELENTAFRGMNIERIGAFILRHYRACNFRPDGKPDFYLIDMPPEEKAHLELLPVTAMDPSSICIRNDTYRD